MVYSRGVDRPDVVKLMKLAGTSLEVGYAKDPEGFKKFASSGK